MAGSNGQLASPHRTGRTIAPRRRISPLMKNADYNESLRFGNEVNGMGEPVEEHAVNPRRHAGKLIRPLGDPLQYDCELIRKTITEAGLLGLGLTRSQPNVELRVGADKDRDHLALRWASSARRSAWTSDHERTSRGRSSYSAKRSSSSARCASGAGTSCSRAAMRSQSAWT